MDVELESIDLGKRNFSSAIVRTFSIHLRTNQFSCFRTVVLRSYLQFMQCSKFHSFLTPFQVPTTFVSPPYSFQSADTSLLPSSAKPNITMAIGGGGGGGTKGGGNGFQSMGLSDPVFRGIVRMGFRVSALFCHVLRCTPATWICHGL
jgi:hypothetical protein